MLKIPKTYLRNADGVLPSPPLTPLFSERMWALLPPPMPPLPPPPPDNMSDEDEEGRTDDDDVVGSMEARPLSMYLRKYDEDLARKGSRSAWGHWAWKFFSSWRPCFVCSLSPAMEKIFRG